MVRRHPVPCPYRPSTSAVSRWRTRRRPGGWCCTSQPGSRRWRPSASCSAGRWAPPTSCPPAAGWRPDGRRCAGRGQRAAPESCCRCRPSARSASRPSWCPVETRAQCQMELVINRWARTQWRPCLIVGYLLIQCRHRANFTIHTAKIWNPSLITAPQLLWTS